VRWGGGSPLGQSGLTGSESRRGNRANPVTALVALALLFFTNGGGVMEERIFHRILVPTDFSPQSERAWATARRLARAVGAEVVLLHVFVEMPLYSEAPLSGERVREAYAAARTWAAEHLEQWAATARSEGLAVKTLLRTGVPHADIVETARDEGADLIAIGTHGRGGLNRLMLGSVCDRVIRLSSCPVLAVREPETN
jgi:nucleotide-binding universal stress UspA family protein